MINIQLPTPSYSILIQNFWRLSKNCFFPTSQERKSMQKCLRFNHSVHQKSDLSSALLFLMIKIALDYLTTYDASKERTLSTARSKFKTFDGYLFSLFFASWGVQSCFLFKTPLVPPVVKRQGSIKFRGRGGVISSYLL